MWYWIVGALIALFIVGNIFRRIRGKNKIICVIEDKCTGCGRCIKKCRKNVLDIMEKDDKKYAFVAIARKCDACGDCITACKFKALELVKK